MFNVQIKKFSLSFLAAVSVVLSGCTEKKEVEGLGEISAKDLENTINQNIEEGKYAEALNLIDTLNVKFPQDVEARKATMLSRAKAMEGLIRDSIPLCDERISALQAEMDSLKQFLTPVEEKGLPGYIIDKSTSKTNLTQGNNIQPRLGDALSPWSLAVGIDGNIDVTGMSVVTEDTTIYVEAKAASERRVKGSGRELFSFSAEEVDQIAPFMNGNSNSPVKLIVHGVRKDVAIPISATTQNAISRIYRFSLLREEKRKALLRRELLERKLIVAQNQVANFTSTNN